MSRHRKVKALDYDEEYDDVYGDYDDDDDFDENAFEAKYLSSGIDLSESNTTSKIDEKRQRTIDEAQSIFMNNSGEIEDLVKQIVLNKDEVKSIGDSGKSLPSIVIESSSRSIKSQTKDCCTNTDTMASDLTKFAIQHLDKHQWQLPLMEMDKKFRDKTYYKHYTDTYITSLRSKLGHFLTDNRLISNPMKYHRKQEIDNYGKYSRMLELLTEYYQSLGGGFFSFATPSPDEEIVIGCRLGTKVKKQPSKQQAQSKPEEQIKPSRFEYHGKGGNIPKKAQASGIKTSKPHENVTKTDLTIREDHTADQLDKLSKKYQESLKVSPKKSSPIPASTKPKSANLGTTSSKISLAVNQNKNNPIASKPLATLTEKRQDLKQQLKRRSEPSTQDREAFKKQAIQTSKEYDEFLKGSRPRVNLVVVGHVDAGKSTLVGHLLYKLGQVTGKQMHKYEVDSQRSGKASFKFAWALDETNEERARGVTIDIALTRFETKNKDIVLLDAPGHVDFIPAVISGAAQADAALLVVDATRGEFETGFSNGGQTREHTYLVRSLGVKSLVVVVNKMDNVDWDWLRFSDIREQLSPFLKQVGFNLTDEVQFVACSGLSGDNLVDQRLDKKMKQSSHPQLECDVRNWSSLPTLLNAIDKMKQPERMVDKPTRVCVTDVFKGMSGGVFLGAKVSSGKIVSKQKLLLMPSNELCEIKQLEVQGSKENFAFSGEIITAVAIGIDMNKYYRGCMLCDPLIPCNVTNRFQARIIMLDSANTILMKGSPIEVHINGTHESGEVRKMISLLNKNTGELIQRKPRCITKNSSAIIQLKLSRVVCCELYEDNKDLGRLMLRSCGKTIAACLITKIKSTKLSKSTTKFKSK